MYLQSPRIFREAKERLEQAYSQTQGKCDGVSTFLPLPQLNFKTYFIDFIQLIKNEQYYFFSIGALKTSNEVNKMIDFFKEGNMER